MKKRKIVKCKSLQKFRPKYQCNEKLIGQQPKAIVKSEIEGNVSAYLLSSNIEFLSGIRNDIDSRDKNFTVRLNLNLVLRDELIDNVPSIFLLPGYLLQLVVFLMQFIKSSELFLIFDLLFLLRIFLLFDFSVCSTPFPTLLQHLK